MSEPEEGDNIVERPGAGNGLRLVWHPVEGHVPYNPELRALLDEIKRQQPAASKIDDTDTPDAA